MKSKSNIFEIIIIILIIIWGISGYKIINNLRTNTGGKESYKNISSDTLYPIDLLSKHYPYPLIILDSFASDCNILYPIDSLNISNSITFYPYYAKMVVINDDTIKWVKGKIIVILEDNKGNKQWFRFAGKKDKGE